VFDLKLNDIHFSKSSIIFILCGRNTFYPQNLLNTRIFDPRAKMFSPSVTQQTTIWTKYLSTWVRHP